MGADRFRTFLKRRDEEESNSKFVVERFTLEGAFDLRNFEIQNSGKLTVVNA